MVGFLLKEQNGLCLRRNAGLVCVVDYRLLTKREVADKRNDSFQKHLFLCLLSINICQLVLHCDWIMSVILGQHADQFCIC